MASETTEIESGIISAHVGEPGLGQVTQDLWKFLDER